MIIYNKNKIIIFFILTLLMIFINNCQTFDAGYGPGNSPNSLLVTVDKGVIELKIYSKITEYNETYDNKKPDVSPWGLFWDVMDALIEEPVPVKLVAGDKYSYYLKHNETAALKIKPVKDDEHNEPSEITIKYRGKEKKYRLKTNILSKSFSYTGG